IRHGFTTVAGPRYFTFLPPPFPIGVMSAPVTGTLNLTTVSGMAVEQEPLPGPSIDWLAAQPYGEWGDVRNAECPVANVGDLMAMGVNAYQVTRYKDAEQVMRDDKTFPSSINAEHIG